MSDSDYDRASISMAQDDFYTNGHNIRLVEDDPTDSHYIQLDQSELPRQPVATQIKPFTEPRVRWGVHFLHEDVITDYGVGDEAKAAAEKSVNEWADSPYPAELVSSVEFPWRAMDSERLKIVQEMRTLGNSAHAVKAMRLWLFEQGYDKEVPVKTGLKEQVPVMREIVRASDSKVAAEILHQWLLNMGYDSH